MAERVCLTPQMRLVLDALRDGRDKGEPMWAARAAALTGVDEEAVGRLLERLVAADWAQAQEGVPRRYGITRRGEARYLAGVAGYASRHPGYEPEFRRWPASAY